MMFLKKLVGNKLWQMLEKHREKTLEMTGNTEESKKYFYYGISEYKFNVIYDNAEQMARQMIYSDDYRLYNWYFHSQFYKRIWEELEGSFVQKLKKILS